MIQIDDKLIHKFYEYFYRRRFNNFSYKFKPSEKAKKEIEKFILRVDKHYGLKTVSSLFLWNYFIYQFNYWRNAELTAVYGKFRIELVIGNKAFKRFVDNEYDNMWVTESSDVIRLYGFKKSDLVKSTMYNSKLEYKNQHEKNIKKLKHNTDAGFYMCISNTTLYNHKHSLCEICNFKNDCKEILKNKFPKIYEKRGY